MNLWSSVLHVIAIKQSMLVSTNRAAIIFLLPFVAGIASMFLIFGSFFTVLFPLFQNIPNFL